MGQTVSTPLSLTKDHWTDVRARGQNLSVKVKKKPWMTFCSSEWPVFGVGWPAEGTFYLPTIRAVKAIVFQEGPGSHPDQQPYIMVWEDLARYPPPWVRPFLPPLRPGTKILAIRENGEKEKPKPPLGRDDDRSTPVTKPPKIYPEIEEPPEWPDTPQPPPYAPQPQPLAPSGPLPQAPAGGGGPSTGTRSRRGVTPEGPADSTVALPLRAIGAPPADPNSLQPLQYWPFSSSDLYNWKAHHPPFSENPAGLTGLVESLMYSHQPTWDDCQQLLQTLFTTEERERILLEARKNVRDEAGRPVQTPAEIDEGFPLTRPRWDYNTASGILLAVCQALENSTSPLSDSPVAAAVVSHFNKCPDSHTQYCFHGTCRFLVQEEKPACVCHSGYVGVRCEHADLLAVVAASQKKQAITALVVVSIVALAVLIITCVLIHCCQLRKHCEWCRALVCRHEKPSALLKGRTACCHSETVV